MIPTRKLLLPVFAWCFFLFTLSHSAAPAVGAHPVQITQLDGKLRIEIDGKLFSEYHYENVSRPFLYPIIGPNGATMVRHWPMKEAPNEERDHPHHRALWYAHGAINGHDFWSEGAKAGKTVHEKFIEVKSGEKTGSFTTLNRLVAKDGAVICTDERTVRIHHRPSAPLLDFDITIHASHGALTLGDTKEGSMAIRLAETMRLKGKTATGSIVNSEGVRDDKTWGKRAKWCDYHGTVNGQVVGVAIMDHPSNPRHPTWWHVRDYGLFAANPFGVHDFEKKPAGTGDLTVPAGGKVTFRYRFYFHEGDEKQSGVEGEYGKYVSQNLQP